MGVKRFRQIIFLIGISPFPVCDKKCPESYPVALNYARDMGFDWSVGLTCAENTSTGGNTKVFKV